MPETQSLFTVPPLEEIEARLIPVMGDGPLTERFSQRLAEDSGQEYVANGVIIWVNVAVYDVSEGMPPIARMLAGVIEPALRALIEDEELRNEVLRSYEAARRLMKDKLDANPSPARPELSEEHKRELMRTIKRIAEVHDEYSTGKWDASNDYRAGGINPIYNQTLDGLFLEFYYSGPSKLWTPWGYWHFSATQPGQFDLEGFMSRLTLAVHREAENTRNGTVGPIYAILAVDGEALPKPMLPVDARQLLPRDVAHAEWNRYFSE